MAARAANTSTALDDCNGPASGKLVGNGRFGLRQLLSSHLICAYRPSMGPCTEASTDAWGWRAHRRKGAVFAGAHGLKRSQSGSHVPQLRKGPAGSRRLMHSMRDGR